MRYLPESNDADTFYACLKEAREPTEQSLCSEAITAEQKTVTNYLAKLTEPNSQLVEGYTWAVTDRPYYYRHLLEHKNRLEDEAKSLAKAYDIPEEIASGILKIAILRRAAYNYAHGRIYSRLYSEVAAEKAPRDDVIKALGHYGLGKAAAKLEIPKAEKAVDPVFKEHFPDIRVRSNPAELV